MRMCCSCRIRKPMTALIRLQTVNGIVLPQTTKKQGRSAWVCPSVNCIQDLHSKPKKLHRSLRAPAPYSVVKLHTEIEHWLTDKVAIQLTQLHRDGVLHAHTSRQPDSTVVLRYDSTPGTDTLAHILTEPLQVLHVPLTSEIVQSVPQKMTAFLTIGRHKQKRTVERWAGLLKELKLTQLRN